MSLSTEAVSLPSQSELPEFFHWKRNPEPWKAEGHAPLREWAHYFGPEQPWVGGQFFYPCWLYDMMTGEHRNWAERLVRMMGEGQPAESEAP